MSENENAVPGTVSVSWPKFMVGNEPWEIHEQAKRQEKGFSGYSRFTTFANSEGVSVVESRLVVRGGDRKPGEGT